MRTRTLAVAVAAAALLPMSVLAASPASAATKHDVLTYGKPGKLGGKNVGVKNVLTANSTASFANGALTCKSSTFTVKVVKNPTAGKATAEESLIGQAFSNCSVGGSLSTYVTSVSVTLEGLPYGVTTSDAKNYPVVVSKPTAKITVVTTIVGTASCVFAAKQIKGTASNKHQTISFADQPLALQSTVSNPHCNLVGTTVTFSATYGPVIDKSVKGHPKVYVN
jgi:hypothetical protein